MNMNEHSYKQLNRVRRHRRIRARLSGTAERPRVHVYKSNQYTYAQVVDDGAHKTLVGMGDAKIKPDAKAEGGTKTKRAYVLGQQLGVEMKKLGIAEALFDRGGFRYHGRVKAVAEGLRSQGIKV